jgi:hypothetical protein
MLKPWIIIIQVSLIFEKKPIALLAIFQCRKNEECEPAKQEQTSYISALKRF